MWYKEEMNDKLAAMLTCYWSRPSFISERKVKACCFQGEYTVVVFLDLKEDDSASQ